MKLKVTAYFFTLLAAVTLTSCYTEDPGPLQETEEYYSIADFDRLEMGDGFHIHVQEGTFYEVHIRGDRRNLNDLRVSKAGTTLVVRYTTQRSRRHDTYVDITMPSLKAANFSGASDSKVYGFDEQSIELNISGASTCQFYSDATTVRASVSGASQLGLRGTGDALSANISGASLLQAFGYEVVEADVQVSGASDARVSVTNRLDAIATGASSVIYRGNPTVAAETSGASTVIRD